MSNCLHGLSEIQVADPSDNPIMFTMELANLYTQWNLSSPSAPIKSLGVRYWDTTNNSLRYSMIDDVRYCGEKEGYEVFLDNGHAVTCSSDQLFYTNKGWKNLHDMGLKKPNNSPYCYLDESLMVTRIENNGMYLNKIVSVKYIGLVDMYDIVSDENYIANDLVVKNY